MVSMNTSLYFVSSVRISISFHALTISCRGTVWPAEWNAGQALGRWGWTQCLHRALEPEKYGQKRQGAAVGVAATVTEQGGRW